MTPPILTPSKSNNRKRNVLTMEKKVEILSKLDKGETSVSLARFYNIGKATVTDIKKNRDAILAFALKIENGDGVKKRKVMKRAKNQDLEKAMEMWFIQKMSSNEPISGAQICEKALEMNEKLGGPEDFKASTGWLQKFKCRNGIRELQFQKESLLLAETSDVEKFKKTLRLFVEKKGLSQDDVYNADETGLNWKALPKMSFASRQESEGVLDCKISKERVTIMTCTNASGTHKLPVLLIEKEKKPQCFKNITSLPVTYAAQKRGWMDSILFLDWFKNNFIKNVKKWRQDRNRTGKVLLLLDIAPPHASAEVLNSIDPNFQVMFFPPNVAPSIQPMNQGVIKEFKMMYRKQILKRLLLNDGTEQSIVDFSKVMDLKHCCYMVADAWDMLAEANVRNAWKKLWSVAEDREAREKTDQNYLGEFVDLFNNIPGFSGCGIDDVVDWLAIDANDLGYNVSDNGEVVTSLQNLNEDEESDDGSSSDESMGVPPKEPSHATAFTAFEIGLEWFEKQPECCPAQSLLLKRLQDLAAQKCVAAIRQLKIDDYLEK